MATLGVTINAIMDAIVPQDFFSNEESVLKALATIRSSVLSTELKAELRDLFLDYAGEPTDSRRDELKNTILEKLSPYAAELPGLTIPQTKVATTVSAEPKSTNSSALGMTRRVPTFAVPATSTKPAPTPVTEPVVTAEVTPPTPVTPEAITPPTEPVPTEVTPEAPIVTPPVVEVVTPEPVAVPTAAPAAPVSGLELKTRIDEIKRDINGKVGNPVNLIGVDETIGREYMSALLNAMKSASGSGGEASASARLESAYKAALSIVAQVPDETKPTITTSESVTPEAEVVAEPEIVNTPTEPVVEEVTVPTPEPEAVETAPEPEPIVEEVEAPAEIVIEPVSQEKKTNQVIGLYHRPIDEVEVESTEPEAPKKSGLLSVRKLNINTPKTETTATETDSERWAVKADTKSDKPLQALDKTTALPDQMEKIKAEVAKREEAAKRPITDLNSPEVQAGLEKLLSEWTLFRSSGFLGTGPSGINHPLYKKLASLPMAAVIAGRFEGSTKEIKQSLTDYMNGWRYEQGVTHEMGEPFERYLRRVIKHILERQRLGSL